MVDRIERVNRVKSVEYDVGRPFERKEGYDDGQGQKGPFRQALQTAIQKKKRAPSAETEEIRISDPYHLELNRATQSLFYKKGTAIRVQGRELHED